MTRRWPIRRVLLYVLFEWLGRFMPFASARFLASPLSGLAWYSRVRRAPLLQNIHAAYPSMADDEVHRLARRSLRNLVTIFLEIPMLRYLDDSRLDRVISYEGAELPASGTGRGLMLLSGHFGNWELLALTAGRVLGRSFAWIAKEQKDFGHMNRMRVSRGNALIPLTSAARVATTMLQEGGSIALLADQSAAPPDPIVTFFGLETHFFGTPARLALRFRPQVLMGCAVRRPDGGYHVVFQELVHDDLDDTPAGRVALTQRYAAFLEQMIGQHPDHWMWVHRRWKHTPGFAYGPTVPTPTRSPQRST